MTSVGIRELKNNLSRYLARVKRGQEVVVTERGKPIARLVKEPPEKSAARKGLDELVAKGLLRPARKRRRRNIPSPLKVGGKPVSEMIIEDRR